MGYFPTLRDDCRGVPTNRNGCDLYRTEEEAARNADWGIQLLLNPEALHSNSCRRQMTLSTAEDHKFKKRIYGATSGNAACKACGPMRLKTGASAQRGCLPFDANLFRSASSKPFKNSSSCWLVGCS